MFKGRHFDQSVILLCVRWYLAYGLSLRDLKEMMAERGISIDHSTIHRWVVHFSVNVGAKPGQWGGVKAGHWREGHDTGKRPIGPIPVSWGCPEDQGSVISPVPGSKTSAVAWFCSAVAAARRDPADCLRR